MSQNLFIRTEVLPEELPINFSNKNLYLAYNKNTLSNTTQKFGKITTNPLNFYIPKNNGDFRKMSLLHPLAQLQIYIYTLKYEQQIMFFAKKSPYSVRSPQNLNTHKIDIKEIYNNKVKKLEEEYGFTNKFLATSEEDNIYFQKYFSYRNHKTLSGLLKSPQFNRNKYKYNYFEKLDIHNFFSSIYTHSLAWILFQDKEMGKKLRNNKALFPNATDNIMTQINYGETNGIITGPEFSRVISELLLTGVDLQIEYQLYNKDLLKGKNYVIYRFMDDYFIFTQVREDAHLIHNTIKNELSKVNLNLNDNKYLIQEKPFQLNNSAIAELRTIFDNFKHDKLYSVIYKNFDIIKSGKFNTYEDLLSISSYKGQRYQWKKVITNIELVINKHPNEKTKIINYSLKAINSQIVINGSHLYILYEIMEIMTSIYLLDINSKSTILLLNNFAKILQIIDNLYGDLTIDKKSRDVTYEKTFQHLFTILKNSQASIGINYDIIAFMRKLDKKLSPSFLSKILDNNSSYFVLCSVAYYILDSTLKKIDKRFYVVQKKLQNYIDLYLRYNSLQGADKNILNGSYFYIINDFSYYPGFNNDFKVKIKKEIRKEKNNYIHRISGNNNEVYKKFLNDILDQITVSPYYNWFQTNDTFTKKLIKKTIFNNTSSEFSY